MVPYVFGSSDGLFNLGSALAYLQTLPPGVYISMNGKYFHWDNVRKNKEVGLFYLNTPQLAAWELHLKKLNNLTSIFWSVVSSYAISFVESTTFLLV